MNALGRLPNSQRPQKITKVAQQYGLILNKHGNGVLLHFASNIPGLRDRVMDTVILDIAHDALLGNWPLQVYGTLFHYCRDTSNPNYFGQQALDDRYEEFDWTGVMR